MGRRLLATLAVTAGLVGAVALVVTSTASAEGDKTGGKHDPPYATIKNKDLPAQIQVDENAFVETARFVGKGKQVYDCVNGAYALREPNAVLHKIGGDRVGIHFVGPQWAHNDGSRVKGAALANVPSPDGAGNVAWLLIQNAENAGAPGLTFATTRRIQRVLTRGGAAPSSCSASSPQTVSIDYSTLYIFYNAK